MKKTLLCCLTWIIMMLTAAAHATSPVPETITIAGTGDSRRVLQILARAFEASHPHITISIPETTGSTAGIRAVAEGRAQLARVTRPLLGTELTLNLNLKTFGYCPIVFVANKSAAGVAGLNSRDIPGIFSGSITRWEQIGGNPAKLYVVNRQIGDTSRRIVEHGLPGFPDISESTGYTSYNVDETIRILERYSGTIAYVPLASVIHTEVVIFRIDGIEPSLENIKNGRYRLVTPFSLVWKGRLSGAAADFSDFIFSPEGRKILEHFGTLPAETSIADPIPDTWIIQTD